MGLTNAAANVMSIIAPLLVGYIVKDDTDPGEWRLVFWISAGIYFFGNLMFVLFSSTEIQVWNDPDQRDRRMYSLWKISPQKFPLNIFRFETYAPRINFDKYYQSKNVRIGNLCKFYFNRFIFFSVK